MKNIFKKLTSMVLAAAATTAAVNFTPLAQSVSASTFETDDKVTVSCSYFPYTYNFQGSGLTPIWGYIPDLTADGQTAYCIDSLADSGDGAGTQSRFTVEELETPNNPLSLAIAYGYTGNTKYGYSAETEQLATQILVWCIQDGWYDNSNESIALDRFTENMGSTLAENVKTVYYKIKAGMQEYNITPSFSSNREKELIYNSSTRKWTLTLSDSNGVANKFDWASALSKYSYLSVSATSSSVTFTSTRAFDTITLTADYNNSAYTPVRAVRLVPDPGQSNEQSCITYKVISDPPEATVKLYAEENTGDLKIIKIKLVPPQE